MKPFIPESLPLRSIDWVSFISLIGQANAELARYDCVSPFMYNETQA